MAKKEEIKVKTVEEFKFVATILRQAQLYASHGLWTPNEGFTKTHPNVLGKKIGNRYQLQDILAAL